MSSRMLGYALLLVLAAAFTFPLMAPTQQSSQNPPNAIKWEYKVAKLDAPTCASDNEVTSLLNALGQQGWNLVSYERVPPAFPRDAEGSLLIAPAATGPSRGVNPPTADSFQGSIAMKLTPTQPGGCRLVLKREWHPPAHP
jgi:hypothetical protein